MLTRRERRVGSTKAQVLEVSDALRASVDRLLGPSGEDVGLDQVVPGRPDAFLVADLRRQLERAVQVTDAVVVPSEMTLQRSGHVQGVAELGRPADLASRSEGVVGEGQCLQIAQFERRLVGDAAQPSEGGQGDARVDAAAQCLGRRR